MEQERIGLIDVDGHNYPNFDKRQQYGNKQTTHKGVTVRFDSRRLHLVKSP